MVVRLRAYYCRDYQLCADAVRELEIFKKIQNNRHIDVRITYWTTKHIHLLARLLVIFADIPIKFALFYG